MRGSILLALPVLAASCGADAAPPGPSATALFVVPETLEELAGERFFEHPFPSDLRREADGTLRFTGWPNPGANALLGAYVDAAAHLLDGASPATPIYLRFSAPLDPASLPATPPATLERSAAVQLVDVDPGSPERGTRRLVQLRLQATVVEGSYWHPNTLAVMPILGRPLRPRTRYALVVTTRARAAGGGAIERSLDLDEVLGLRPATARTERARAIFAPAVAELERAGVAARDVVHATVLTTSDPTAELFAIADDLKTGPAPSASGWSAKETTAEYDVYEGSYGPTPNFQIGTAPYTRPEDGGGFVIEGGKPKQAGTYDLRFALAVPWA